MREQHAQPRGGLDGALLDAARLGDADVQRHLGQFARELLVGGNRREHVVRLGGHDDVLELPLVEVLDKAPRGQRELLGLSEVVACRERIFERTGVHADADGNARLAGSVYDGVDALGRADVAGIDAERRGTAMRGADGDLVVEVDVRDDGQWAHGGHLLEIRQRRTVGDSDAHDLASGVFQAQDLIEVAARVQMRALTLVDHGDVGHRLDDDGRPSPDRDGADLHGTGLLARSLLWHG